MSDFVVTPIIFNHLKEEKQEQTLRKIKEMKLYAVASLLNELPGVSVIDFHQGEISSVKIIFCIDEETDIIGKFVNCLIKAGITLRNSSVEVTNNLTIPTILKESYPAWDLEWENYEQFSMVINAIEDVFSVYQLI